jgi:tetraacyldisaccharide 4'-kinase
MREPFWWGPGAVATAVAWGLVPFSWAWRVAVAARNAAFDFGVVRPGPTSIPTISVGNISVGGTGKTPITAWLAGEVIRRGRRPGIVLRGYGADEPEVHRALVPDAVVVTDPDRVRGVARARAEGAAVALLDDAFQHRRVRRDFDLVVVSADVPWGRWTLPAGPLREPTSALRRADLVLVTAKAASAQEVERCMEQVRLAGARAVGAVRLAPSELRAVHAEARRRSLADLDGARVLCISGIGNPQAFRAGLRALGADVLGADFPDHHAFGAGDVVRLVARAGEADLVVCTLKDAVKLRGLWPRSGPDLWYVSQRMDLLSGTAVLVPALDRACGPPDTFST